MWLSRLFWKFFLTQAALLVVLALVVVGLDNDRLVLLACGVYLIVGLAATYWITRSAVLPIRQLTRELQRLELGESPDPVYVASFDEVGQLADRFNRMSQRIGARLSELDDSRGRMATVLGNMIEGVIAVDERQRVLFANDAAGRLLGFEPAQAVGRGLMESVRNHVLHEAVNTAFAAGGSKSVVPRTLVLESPTHSQTLSINTTRLPGKPCPGVVLVLHDVTELRRLENLRQDFVANVSHELKTPLSSIKAYAETLQNGALADSEHNHLFVARIEEQADRLHQLIIDMLSLARIESGQQTFEIVRIDLGPIVTEVCEQALPAAEEQQLRLHVEASAEPCQVRADEEGLREIVANLVSNAVKYTPAGGQVWVRYRTEDRQVVIEVQDTGIGIPTDGQARVFERFYRVDRARSRELGGTGLGLSIVKHLCLAFGGSVAVKSKLGEGSTFTVRLPAG
ncbi:MAG: ATP-binding protein [Pirellulales bacterium]